jgi:hypothetical protein
MKTMLLLFTAVLFKSAPIKAQDTAADDAKAKQAYALGVTAYIWGYPMVVNQKTRDAMTKGGDVPVTPEAPFYMLLRMYQPDIEILNGQL